MTILKPAGGPHQGAGVGGLRRQNISLLLRTVHAHGPLTRAELTARLGLNRSTVKSLIEELSAHGLVREGEEVRRQSPGRPSRLVYPCPDAFVVLGIDIAVDSLAVAMVGLGGHVKHLDRMPLDAGLPLEQALEAIRVRATAQFSATADAPLMGIGVGIVGIVRRPDGFLHQAPNLGWHDVPLADAVRGALGFEGPVHVANEADLGALVEQRRGAAVGVNDMIFISGEVGIGTGIIVGGRPLSGASGYAGEAGHMRVNPRGRRCRCGGRGCWETEAGEAALLRLAGRDGERRGWPVVEEVLQAAADGDARCRGALDELGMWLGVGLSNLINLLNPKRVVLGGLFGRIYPAVQPVLLNAIDGQALPANRAAVDIVPSLFGLDAPLLGAAELALQPALEAPLDLAAGTARHANVTKGP